MRRDEAAAMANGNSPEAIVEAWPGTALGQPGAAAVFVSGAYYVNRSRDAALRSSTCTALDLLG